MAKPLDPTLKKIIADYGVDPKDALWDCHGTWVIYHRHLEIIAAKAGITFDPPLAMEANGREKCVALCVTGRMGDRQEWSVGESSPSNNKNSYPYAMAEKRAKDRVIIKLIGLSGFVYSEEEADDFRQSASEIAAINAINACNSREELTNLLNRDKEIFAALPNGGADRVRARASERLTQDFPKAKEAA